MQQLSSEDITLIKSEMKFGIKMGIVVFISLSLINFIVYEAELEISIKLVLLIELGILILSYLISYLYNRNYYKDLEVEVKESLDCKLTRKKSIVIYEAGSGAIPGKDMVALNKCFFIINNFQYEVDEITFNKYNEGDNIKMQYTMYSKMLLNPEFNL